MRITTALLSERRTCAEQVSIFAEEWPGPSGAFVDEASVRRAQELGLNLHWFVRNFLDPAVHRTYSHTVFGALVLYEEEVDAAWEAFRAIARPARQVLDQESAPGRERYQEAVARALDALKGNPGPGGRQAYQAAIGLALEAYQAATSGPAARYQDCVGPAQETLSAALANAETQRLAVCGQAFLAACAAHEASRPGPPPALAGRPGSLLHVIGFEGDTVCSASRTREQIEAVERLDCALHAYWEAGVGRHDPPEAVTWPDLDNPDERRTLLQAIESDRHVRVELGQLMADRPPFAVVTEDRGRAVRLEYYEGHDALALTWEFRAPELFGARLPRYLERDPEAYDPLGFLETLGLLPPVPERPGRVEPERPGRVEPERPGPDEPGG